MKLFSLCCSIAGVNSRRCEVVSLPHEHPRNDWLPDCYICVTDQTLSQDNWILAEFFFAFFFHQDDVEVHRKTGKEANIKTCLVKKDLSYSKEISLY